MILTVLNSGSDGNCYLLESENEILILDCGVPCKEVKKALNFDLSKVSGCLITHSHSDHAKYKKDFEMCGFDMLIPYEQNIIRVNKRFGNFTIQAFQLPHGDTNSYGFLIRHMVSKETILYLTDFEYCRYTFKACHVNHYLIECNYQDEYVDLDAPNKAHKLLGHASLTTCKNFVKANHNNDMQTVILCHLGKVSTNPFDCVEEVQKVITPSVIVDYARPNTVYELKNMRLPFDDAECEET